MPAFKYKTLHKIKVCQNSLNFTIIVKNLEKGLFF